MDFRRILLGVAAVAAVAAPVLQLSGVQSPVRVVAGLLLFTLAPGAALLPLLGTRAGRPLELGLVVATSLAVVALTAQGMLWLGVWSPTGASVVLGAACLPLVLWHLRAPAPGVGR